jgi:DNA-binding NtrC family response regulator
MPAFGDETILLVDDEELVRELGTEMLEWAGYNVLTAVNGQEALELYRRKKSDISLVILDLIMPKLGGKQCLEELLAIDPEVKVLVASGYSADGPTKNAIGSGAKGFISKPYDAKEILRVVRKVLDED